MATVIVERERGKVSRSEQGKRRAMLRAAYEVDVWAAELGFVPVKKKDAWKLLKKEGNKVLVRWVEEFKMMFIEPVPF
jgi:hypothetical protein